MRSALLIALAALLGGCSSSSPAGDGTRDLGAPDTTTDGPGSTDVDPSLPLNVSAPSAPVKLVFIHHSVGEGWLSPSGGDLREQLNQNSYFVSDTNYGWGPDDAESSEGTIGDHTDIGQWSHWFLGPNRDTYLGELYANVDLTDGLGPNSIDDPGGEHSVVLFKSCFLSGLTVHGNPGDPPAAPGSSNPIYGKDHTEDLVYTVANIKGIYRDLLGYFATRQDKLFVLITTPPGRLEDTDPSSTANLRDINTWLVRHWLDGYPSHNAAVFDFHNVLTSNGGSPDENDAGAASGNHHRWSSNAVEHVVAETNDYLAYPSDDSHPTPAGTQKASAEFVPLLNAAYHCWKGTGGCPHLMGRP